ncbi:ABC transporter ATP-binding protein [Ktedonospora formicarum]|uniref:Putative ABC transporter ATP-binding protein n=1 Tax=Ktedonospora formicarum TaxID=2778364 RepID=A0A8J3I495_9CHLR|nr:ABC transporter ATP-binding protein [Ktedonospora formicarum]GHO46658.1 putative ABC transporter ATP-binding protein [Ktedonospora formicarum]
MTTSVEHNSSASPLAIDVHQLSFRYRAPDEDEKEKAAAHSYPSIIENISFQVAAGELLLIAGPSGSGKSTLIRCLNGLIPNSYKGVLKGKIQLQSRSTRGLKLRDLAPYIGTMLQDPDKQVVGSTVEQEVAFGLENLGTPRAEMRQRIQAALKQLHLEAYQGRETFALSGGQRQQVAAAGLLVMQPAIMLFDEPFANLDSRAIDELEQLISTLRAEGRTIVIVEHRVEEALRLKPDKVLLLHEGKQAFFGTTKEFMANPSVADPTQVKLPIEATLHALPSNTTVREWLIQPIATAHSASDNEQVPVLRFEDVHYRYGLFSNEVLRGISFDVRRGETIALLGPNGSGKTTLVKQALGLLRPTRGHVTLHQDNTRKLSVAQLASRIGYVFQSPNAMLFAPTVAQEVAFGPTNLHFSKERLHDAVQTSIKALNVDAFEKRSPFSLSFGQQKRVAIASVLAMQGNILLLDEPTAGQDHRSYISFMEYLRHLPGLDALLFITHDLDLALRYTQRVLLLKEGQLVADGSPLDVLSDRNLLEECNLRPTSLLRYLLAEHAQVGERL